jgi:excisionase family DNA binding protein
VDEADTAGSSLLDEVMTSQQLADILQMRLSTVEAYARRGVLPSVELGRHRRFIRSDVQRAVMDQDKGSTQSDLEELITAPEVAEMLQMRLSTIEDYARRGILPSVKLGRHRRFRRSEVERTVAR